MLGASANTVLLRIAQALLELPPSADMLYLEYCFEACSKMEFLSPVIARAFSPASTASIIFTQRGARRALALIERNFLPLDNMYAELISHGDLEAYAVTPPALYQDMFWARGTKYGDRGHPGLTHSPFSILCTEQHSEFDLTVIRALPAPEGMEGAVRVLSSSDAFEEREWRRHPGWANASVEIGDRDRDLGEESDFIIGTMAAARVGLDPVILHVDRESDCFPRERLVQCFLTVYFIGGGDEVIGYRFVTLSPRMFLEAPEDPASAGALPNSAWNPDAF
mmetsp:Transcript_7342/g.22447  ORF Transcript_7342/g.22447 Transcript_7342/m.22447 type:complete len:280 (+) Transcript_7342:141-980(+)